MGNPVTQDMIIGGISLEPGVRVPLLGIKDQLVVLTAHGSKMLYVL